MNSSISNQTLQTIYARHSIRQFQDRPVADEMIRTILDAANQAPSAHNQQSWRFVVLREKKRLELAHLVAARANDFPKPSSSILRMASRCLASAPVVISVSNTGSLIAHGSELFNLEHDRSLDFFRTMEIQSSAAAVENLLLAATSLGLGSVWLGILYLLKEEVLAFLGEENGEFMAVIPIGHPKKDQGGPQKKSLEYVLKEFA
ncbi:MAG: nitroreductase family protein [Desulforhopalus sp.]|nr:nitroreductase family protein [Desulforhopalus sp.]